MARIRTIKPEFFTSEDIVKLSAFARLLYIALWCEADKEGRLVWKPRTFKMRYLPADECDIEVLCAEITSAGLVTLYGEGYAYIPAFKAHQHVNPRESVSQIPDPSTCTRAPRVTTRAPRVSDASPRDSDAQGGREGKGREGKDIPPTPQRGDERFEDFWLAWPKNDRKHDRGRCHDLWRGRRLDEVAETILADVKAKRGTVKWRDGYIEAPLVYLRNSRWEDGGLDLDGTAEKCPAWCSAAGFANVWEAENAGCFEHNTDGFRDGKKIEVSA